MKAGFPPLGRMIRPIYVEERYDYEDYNEDHYEDYGRCYDPHADD
jgi:hypothetical protein